jgi:hypothetical protein
LSRAPTPTMGLLSSGPSPSWRLVSLIPSPSGSQIVSTKSWSN